MGEHFTFLSTINLTALSTDNDYNKDSWNGRSHSDSAEEHGISPSIHYIKLSSILSEKIPTLAVELEGASEVDPAPLVAPAPLLLPPAPHPPPAPPCPGSNPPG